MKKSREIVLFFYNCRPLLYIDKQYILMNYIRKITLLLCMIFLNGIVCYVSEKRNRDNVNLLYRFFFLDFILLLIKTLIQLVFSITYICTERTDCINNGIAYSASNIRTNSISFLFFERDDLDLKGQQHFSSYRFSNELSLCHL